MPSLRFEGINTYLLLAIPMFMTVGPIMNRGGKAEKIFDFVNTLVGWSPGGLGGINVVASMLFGGISGSSAADASGLAPIEMRAMMTQDYPKTYSAAISVASSTLAVVIPPSVLLVVYGVVAETSVSEVLVGGYLPGITIGLGKILYNYIIFTVHGDGEMKPLLSLMVDSGIDAIEQFTPSPMTHCTVTDDLTAARGHFAIWGVSRRLISAIPFRNTSFGDSWTPFSRPCLRKIDLF